MEYWYQFKQMCKTADTKLKQFPLTGVLPDRLAHPLYPDALLNVSVPMPLSSVCGLWSSHFVVFHVLSPIPHSIPAQ